MEQILERDYFRNMEYWQRKARALGGLEICDDETGQPMYTIGVDRNA